MKLIDELKPEHRAWIEPAFGHRFEESLDNVIDEHDNVLDAIDDFALALEIEFDERGVNADPRPNFNSIANFLIVGRINSRSV